MDVKIYDSTNLTVCTIFLHKNKKTRIYIKYKIKQGG